MNSCARTFIPTALAALIDRWWDTPILHFEADSLWLLSARDDLARNPVLRQEILALGLGKMKSVARKERLDLIDVA